MKFYSRELFNTIPFFYLNEAENARPRRKLYHTRAEFVKQKIAKSCTNILIPFCAFFLQKGIDFPVKSGIIKSRKGKTKEETKMLAGIIIAGIFVGGCAVFMGIEVISSIRWYLWGKRIDKELRKK